MKNRIIFAYSLLIFTIAHAAIAPALSQDTETHTVTLSEFITQAAQNDPTFQKILIDELYLKYRRDLEVPAESLVFDIAGQYDLIFNDQTSAATTSPEDMHNLSGSAKLSQLFPTTGTTVSAAYDISENTVGNTYYRQSSFSLQVSQEIARNAFGSITRREIAKIGIENDLARYQVIEAYEDYLASLITLYLSWYSSWENVKMAQQILQYNNELYQTIRGKQRYRIALPEEVEKIKLEVLSAQQQLITLEDQYQRNRNHIAETGQYRIKTTIVPAKPVIADDILNKSPEERDFTLTRTYLMLQLLEKKGILAEKIAKDKLLPSVSLFMGYAAKGDDYAFTNPNHSIFTGVTSSISILQKQERAQHKTAKIDLRKVYITNKTSIQQLTIDVFNIKTSIEKQQKQIQLAEQKKEISGRILLSERRNFLIGKASINDLILIKNNTAQAHYSVLFHKVQLYKLLVEWKRLSDTLVSKAEANPQIAPQPSEK